MPVERRAFGCTGLSVPAIGLGTYKVFNVSGDAAEARCEAVVDAAMDEGVNFFDSSPMYGHAERLLANCLSDRRDNAIVATKVWARTRAVGEQQIEQALEWYERVELYQVHNLLATEDHLPYLEHLKAGGRISHIGATHYLTKALPDLMALMRDGRIDTVQVPYHPLERSVENQLLPEAESSGIGVVIMMPLNGGKLLSKSPPPEDLAPLAEFGVFTWAQALLKWVLSDPRVHVAIPATSSVDHMRENAAAGRAPWFTGEERTYVRMLAEKLF